MHIFDKAHRYTLAKEAKAAGLYPYFLPMEGNEGSEAYVNAVLAPATPPGHQLLRTSYLATHTGDQLDRVLEAFEVVGKELDLVCV